jgi:hypothetical protein
LNVVVGYGTHRLALDCNPHTNVGVIVKVMFRGWFGKIAGLEEGCGNCRKCRVSGKMSDGDVKIGRKEQDRTEIELFVFLKTIERGEGAGISVINLTYY